LAIEPLAKEKKTLISGKHQPTLVVNLGHSSGVHSVALSDDGKLVTGSSDKTARLWDVVSGKEIRVFRGHSGGIASVCLSADGKWLVTGSDDKTARLWDVATATEIRAFKHANDGIYCVP